MIIVGYLYNRNGMASWCMDAAKALHDQGIDVILIKSKNISLPATFPVKYMDFEGDEIDYNGRSTSKKIYDKFFKYYQLIPLIKRNDNFLSHLNKYLLSNGIKPTCYMLNQTSLVSTKIKTPQYVTAWTYKPNLKDYLRKAFLLANNISTLQANLYNAFFWHKVDWSAYKDATGVFAVSERLKESLSKQAVRAYTIYPGTEGGSVVFKKRQQNQIINLAVMALDIDEKRKGLKTIIGKLKKLKPYNFKLTLIGGCNEEFKRWVLEEDFPAIFTGLLSREKAVEVLESCDVLLFGSLVDDWGFVQVEAMSRGMAVLSPNASPFDEIVGRADYLYDPFSDIDLDKKLSEIIAKDNIEEDKMWFNDRYDALFSLKVFGINLSKFNTDK